MQWILIYTTWYSCCTGTAFSSQGPSQGLRPKADSLDPSNVCVKTLCEKPSILPQGSLSGHAEYSKTPKKNGLSEARKH